MKKVYRLKIAVALVSMFIGFLGHTQNIKTVSFHFDAETDTSISICGGEMIEFTHNITDAEKYDWEWKLGDGTVSKRSNNVVHMYDPELTADYEMWVTNNSVAWSTIINIHVTGKSIQPKVLYDTIYCVGQKAILTLEEYNENYYMVDSDDDSYQIVNNFNAAGYAYINFVKKAQSELIIGYTNDICESSLRLPFLCASFDSGESEPNLVLDSLVITPKYDLNTKTLVVTSSLGAYDDDLNQLSYEWASYKKEKSYSSMEPELTFTTNSNYGIFETNIDTTAYLYSVKVVCESCNSCNTLLFYPEFK